MKITMSVGKPITKEKVRLQRKNAMLSKAASMTPSIMNVTLESGMIILIGKTMKNLTSKTGDQNSI
jgi:hypothetical protein